MNRNIRNLTILIAVMLLAVVALCACIADQPPDTEDVVATTTDPGYGFDGWDDVDENGANEVPEMSEQGREDSIEPSASVVVTTPTSNATMPTTDNVISTPEAGSLTYEQFMNLSAVEQQAYALAFPSVEDYVLWFNAEKEKFENERENDSVIEITGPIDLGEIAGNNKG